MAGAAEYPEGNKHKFTLELFFYSLSFALALALRLLNLGRWPLLDEEAALALAAWRFAHGLPASLRGHSPLLFHGNALLFSLIGDSDALARSWCVLFGSLLVLLPYGLRRFLGRTGALAASTLMAVSPSFTYFSRAVNGSMIVAFCALGLLVGVMGYLEERRPAYVLAMAALLVWAILADPSVYTLLTMLATFPLFLYIQARLAKKELLLDELKRAWHELNATPYPWRIALILAALLFLTAGLAFTLNPAGLQMTLDQFALWVTRFDFLGKSPWYRTLLLLFLYESLPLFFGAVGFFLDRARSDHFALFLRYWFAFALLFSIVPGYRPPSSVLLILMPLILASGRAIENLRQGLLQTIKQPLLWALVTLSLVITAAISVQLAGYLLVPTSTYLMRMVALCVFSASAYAMLWSLSGSEIPLRAAGISLLLLLLFVLIRVEVGLNYARARDPLEPIVGTATSADLLELAQQARQLSHHLQGDPYVMAWQVDERLEVPLGWYLRHFERVSYVRVLDVEPEAPAVITLASAPAPVRYVGLRFRLRSSWADGNYPLIEWIRWWAGFKSTLTEHISGDEITLWVKSSALQ